MTLVVHETDAVCSSGVESMSRKMCVLLAEVKLSSWSQQNDYDVVCDVIRWVAGKVLAAFRRTVCE